MRKLKLYIASSLDGFIADPEGSVSWLDQFPPPENEDYGYTHFQASTDATIQGFKTYKQLLDWGIDFPYKQENHYVFTRDSSRTNNKAVEFISSDPIQFINELKNKKGKDIWLIGGGQINTLCLNAQLIDEIFLFIMPIVLSKGIRLFGGKPKQLGLKLIETKSYENGVIQLHYQANQKD